MFLYLIVPTVFIVLMISAFLINQFVFKNKISFSDQGKVLYDFDSISQTVIPYNYEKYLIDNKNIYSYSERKIKSNEIKFLNKFFHTISNSKEGKKVFKDIYDAIADKDVDLVEKTIKIKDFKMKGFKNKGFEFTINFNRIGDGYDFVLTISWDNIFKKEKRVKLEKLESFLMKENPNQHIALFAFYIDPEIYNSKNTFIKMFNRYFGQKNNLYFYDHYIYLGIKSNVMKKLENKVNNLTKKIFLNKKNNLISMYIKNAGISIFDNQNKNFKNIIKTLDFLIHLSKMWKKQFINANSINDLHQAIVEHKEQSAAFKEFLSSKKLNLKFIDIFDQKENVMINKYCLPDWESQKVFNLNEIKILYQDYKNIDLVNQTVAKNVIAKNKDSNKEFLLNVSYDWILNNQELILENKNIVYIINLENRIISSYQNKIIKSIKHLFEQDVKFGFKSKEVSKDLVLLIQKFKANFLILEKNKISIFEKNVKGPEYLRILFINNLAKANNIKFVLSLQNESDVEQLKNIGVNYFIKNI